MSGDITFGNNANGSVTLSVSPVALPSPPNVATYFANAYYWTIPSGWRFPNGALSNGSTPQLIAGNNANSITVTPSGDGGGTVQVRAASRLCDPNVVSSQSQPASVNITRPVPTLRIATDTPLPTPLTCGDTRDFGFRAEASNVPAGGSFGPYAWTASNGWSVPNPTAQRPGIRPTGSNGSTIMLQGRYTRNGFGTDVVAAPLTIGYTSQVAKPTLGGNQPAQLCNGASTELSASAIGATRYEWTPNNPAVQVTPLTANASQVRLTAPAQGAFDA